MNTNSTDAETIANVLDGIRLVKVGEIIVYREMLGSSQSIEELTGIRGIGMPAIGKIIGLSS